GAVHDDGGALAGELVDDVQQLQGAAIDGGVELEVHCPQRVRRDRAHGPDRGADPAVGLLALAVGHLQAFLSPQALDPLVVDLPARSSAQDLSPGTKCSTGRSSMTSWTGRAWTAKRSVTWAGA